MEVDDKESLLGGVWKKVIEAVIKRFSVKSPKINHRGPAATNANDDHGITQMECSADVIPEALIIEEKIRGDGSEIPLCEGDSLEFYRKYKGHIGRGLSI